MNENIINIKNNAEKQMINEYLQIYQQFLIKEYLFHTKNHAEKILG